MRRRRREGAGLLRRKKVHFLEDLEKKLPSLLLLLIAGVSRLGHLRTASATCHRI